MHRRDGAYLRPKNPQIFLYEKRYLHFKKHDLTNSSEGANKSLKVSLLSFHKPQIIPNLKGKVIARLNNGHNRKVHILKQEDSTRDNRKSFYLREM